MIFEQLAGKRIGVLGLGANHHSLVTLLLSKGFDVTVLDQNPEAERRYADLGTIKFIGGPVLGNIAGFDVLFRSPLVPWLSPELVQAREDGVLVTSQTNLFLDLCPCKVIGVTGTKGKGTTASLVAHILKDGYSKGTTYLAGNIGLDPFSFYSGLTPDDTVVLELSSFQTQDLAKSPQIGILLRITPDHLDYHKDMSEYRQAKYRMFAHQAPGSVAIINVDTVENAAFADTLSSEVIRYTAEDAGQLGIDIDKTQLLGSHNVQNIIPAVLLAKKLGISDPVIMGSLATFTGLPHRLERVSEKTGTLWVDDSIATTPESGTSSVAAFPGRQIHLIAGGNTKGAEYGEWCAVARQCASVSLLSGTMTDQVKGDLPAAYIAQGQTGQQQMADSIARLHPEPGSIVLLAPAATSFAGFTSYADRGDVFASLARERCA